MEKLKLFSKVHVISFFYLSISATQIRAETLPSYNEIFDAQKKCDVQLFNKIKWAKVRGLAGLAVKSWAVISDLKITEINGRKEKPLARRFKVSFKGWNTIDCGLKVSQIDPSIKPYLKGTVFTIVEYSKQDSGLSLVASDDNPDGEESELWRQFLFTDTDGGLNDESGLTCLVDKDDFLKDLHSVDLKKLCKGESPARVKLTEEYLKVLQKKLKE